MIGKMLLNSLLCYPEVFPLKIMFKRTQDLKGSDVGFCLEALRGMSKCEGVPAEAVPSSACKSTVILCSNKGLGFLLSPMTTHFDFVFFKFRHQIKIIKIS